MPPVYLKKPSMNFKFKSDKNYQKQGPKAVLFEDHKKSDLFDFDENEIQSDDHQGVVGNDHEDGGVDDEENDLFKQLIGDVGEESNLGCIVSHEE